MIEKILRLGKDTAVYGVSSIVGRFLNFLLVPFYTHYLAPSEYGTVATLYSYIAFGFIIYGYGLESAYMRYVASLEIGDKKQNFSTPFLSLWMTSAILSLGVFVFSDEINRWIGLGVGGGLLIRYAAWILFFDALVIIPFASLRMELKAKTFAGLKVFNILVNVAANVVLLVVMNMRAEGVLLANLIASVVTFLVLLKMIFSYLTFRLPEKLYPALLKFGLPLIPAGIASVAMHVIDRPILKALTDEATVGVYQANYRLGILMMLLVSMFDYAWRPFYLTHYNDSDAKPMFARVFTYLVALLAFVLVAVSFFIEDLIQIKILGGYFFNQAYWSGVAIVPWILLSYIFAGAYGNFVIGVNIEKKTHYLPLITGAGAVVNVVANYLLVPYFGMMGAAYATLASYVTMAIGIYFPSQRLYRVEYEWGKVIRIALCVGVVFVAYGFIAPVPATASGILVKSLLVCAFVLLLFVTRVVNSGSVVLLLSKLRSSA